MSTPGEAIRRARQRAKLRQEDLAGATGVSERTIGRIETGAVKDSPGIAILEQYLGIDTAAVPEPIPTLEIEAALEAASDIQLAAQVLKRMGRAREEAVRLGRDYRWPDTVEQHKQADEADQA